MDGATTGAKDKKKSVSRSEKARLLFPVSRMTRTLKKDGRSKRVAAHAGVCIAAALQYCCAEVVELAAKRCLKDNRKRISPQDIINAIRTDRELNQLTNGLVMSCGETLKKVSQQLKLNELKEAEGED